MDLIPLFISMGGVIIKWRQMHRVINAESEKFKWKKFIKFELGGEGMAENIHFEFS